MTLFESIAAIFRLIATPRTASEGQRIATAYVAKKLLEKARAGELANIAELAETHERRRMEATTRTAEAQADAAEKQAKVHEAQAFKTTLESLEIAHRLVASGNRDRPGSMAAAEAAVDRTLSRLLQSGGSSPVDGPELTRIAASTSPDVGEPAGTTEVVTTEAGELLVTGLAPTTELKASVEIRASVDVAIPIGVQAAASVGDSTQEPASEIGAEGSAVLNTSPLNSFAFNDGPVDKAAPGPTESKVPFNSAGRVTNVNIATREWVDQTNAAARAADVTLGGSAAHRFIAAEGPARTPTVEPPGRDDTENTSDSPSD